MGVLWETNTANCLSQYPDGRIFLGGRSTDCDMGTCYYTSSMSRLVYDSAGSIIVDTLVNDTVSHASIQETSLLDNLILYPNPIQTGNLITFNSLAVIENIEIYSALGRIVYSKNINGINTIRLPDNFKSGLYFIVFKSSRNQIVKKIKIID